jgi:hypothetical protein
MISLMDEHKITLGEVPAEIPSRLGNRLHVSTVHRWATTGVKGVILESIKIGGQRYTSKEALQRFVERCSAGPASSATTTRTPTTRRKAIEKAERELDRAGI